MICSNLICFALLCSVPVRLPRSPRFSAPVVCGVCVVWRGIQVSNLNRQFLFREHNVGQAKSTAAAIAAKAMNSSIKVRRLFKLAGRLCVVVRWGPAMTSTIKLNNCVRFQWSLRSTGHVQSCDVNTQRSLKRGNGNIMLAVVCFLERSGIHSQLSTLP